MAQSGSQIAKSGLKAEDDFEKRLNSNKDMLDELNIKNVRCVKPEHGIKSDRIILIEYNDGTTKIERVSIKKSLANFSQIDRGWYERFCDALKAREEIGCIFNKYCGEEKQGVYGLKALSDSEIDILISWCEENKKDILKFALLGEKGIPPDIMAILDSNSEEWYVYDFDSLINKMAESKVVRKRNCIHIGDFISLQRKGGDKDRNTKKPKTNKDGREYRNHLQFKMKVLSCVEAMEKDKKEVKNE